MLTVRKTAAAGRVVMVGPFPPPRHGLSAVNEWVSSFLAESGVDVIKFDTAPVALGTSAFVRASRLRRLIRAMRGVRNSATNESTVYLSVSGGWGMIYELGIVRAARSRGARIMLHHHSFRYLDDAFRPMRWLSSLAGKEAVHVVLCPRMGAALKKRYPASGNTLIMSNAAWLSSRYSSVVTRTSGCRVIGHLSNLTEAKGIFDVVEMAERAQQDGSAFEFRVAGPFEGVDIERAFRSRAATLPNVSYKGPLYGEAKERFFDSVDAFVFPTRYRNEAEPLVIHEALAAGCPVIAYDRGSIGALVDDDCGLLVPRSESFVDCATSQLRSWMSDAAKHSEMSRGAVVKSETLRRAGTQARLEMLDSIRVRKFGGA